MAIWGIEKTFRSSIAFLYAVDIIVLETMKAEENNTMERRVKQIIGWAWGIGGAIGLWQWIRIIWLSLMVGESPLENLGEILLGMQSLVLYVVMLLVLDWVLEPLLGGSHEAI